MSDLFKTQWHAPFCAAIKLELRADKNNLEFEDEHTLNTQPIRLDLLVIKKAQKVVIRNEIGRIFKGHNIFEYKSPKDELGVDEYFKTVAYACLYKAACPTADSIKADDITISLVREGMPRSLFKWFSENGCSAEEVYPGIYYVEGPGILFLTQILVCSRLTNSEHEWLMSLTDRLNEETGRRLIISLNELSDKSDKENADSILQLALKENAELFRKLKEVPEMCEALAELMKPEIDAKIEKAVKTATQAQNDEILRLRDENAKSEKDLADREKDLADREKDIADCEKEIAERDEIIRELQAQLAMRSEG